MSSDHWIERAQSAEAQLQTMRQSKDAALNRIRDFKTNFGLRELDTGQIVIEYDKFVASLGKDNALELRVIIDEQYGK